MMLLRIILFCLLFHRAWAGWTTNPVVPAVTDLGTMMQANIQERQAMFTATNGDLHLVLYYDWVSAPASSTIQMVDVNLVSGAARLTNTIVGRPVYPVFHTNGNLYMASGATGNYQSNQLCSFNPESGQVSIVANMILNKQTMTLAIGDDGMIYIGQTITNGVQRYDPATGAMTNFGNIDSDAFYSYYIGADGSYIYVSLLDNTLGWYLGVHDIANGTNALYWKGELDTAGQIYRRSNAVGWYYKRHKADDSHPWYSLTNGVANPISDPTDYYAGGESFGVVIDSARMPVVYNKEINLDYINPSSVSNSATIQWRTVGAGSWSSATVTNFTLYDINIKRLYPWTSTKLFGFADQYGPVFLYDFVSTAVTDLGRPIYSLYNACFQGTTIYLSGYARANLRYESTLPWTLFASVTNMSATNINPHLIGFTGGKYNYYSEVGSDGQIYFGNHHEGDSTGGELGWYDPVTRTNSSLRTEFLDDDVHDLKPAVGATKMVYVSHNDKFFIFDVATKTIDRIITNSTIGAFDKVIEAESGTMFGVLVDSNYVARVNITSGAVSGITAIPGTPFGTGATYDHRLTKGPDGFAWLTIGNDLYRINPQTCALSLVKTNIAPHIETFSGGDCYLYNPATADLHVLKDLLLRTTDATATTLRVGTLRGP